MFVCLFVAGVDSAIYQILAECTAPNSCDLPHHIFDIWREWDIYKLPFSWYVAPMAIYATAFICQLTTATSYKVGYSAPDKNF